MSSTKPEISVIMPTYNSVKFLPAAIESILNQSFTNFEFIIVNDASTDNTNEILEKYAKLDNRILILNNEKNLNIADSRNRGLEVAKGDYIATMDADDVALPSRLKDQYDFLVNNPSISISIGNINVMNEIGEFQYVRNYPILDKDLRSKVYRFNPFPNPTIMCKKQVYDKVGRYSNDFVPIDDFDFWLRAGKKFVFGNCDKVVLNYRVMSSSNSHAKIRKTEELTFKLRLKAYKLGYKYNLLDIFINIAHLISFFLLPSRVKIWLFNIIRKYKILG